MSETAEDPQLCRCGKPGNRSYRQAGDHKTLPTHWRCPQCFIEDQNTACATLGFVRPKMKYANVPKVCDGCGSKKIVAGWPWIDLCAKCDRIFDRVLNEGLAKCPPCLDDQGKP